MLSPEAGQAAGAAVESALAGRGRWEERYGGRVWLPPARSARSGLQLASYRVARPTRHPGLLSS